MGYLARLQSSTARPHCVSFSGNILIDPAEPWLLYYSWPNLDEICGGPGNYRGMDWLYEIKKMDQGISGQRAMASAPTTPPICVSPPQANVYWSETASNSKQFWHLLAAAAFDFGLIRLAKKLKKRPKFQSIGLDMN